MTMVWIFTMCHQDDLYAPGSPIRQLLMQAATLDVRRYFRPPGEVVIHGRQQKHINEVDWLLRFNARGILPGQLEEFVTIYRLRRFATWQYEHLAAIVNKWPLRLKEFYHYELKRGWISWYTAMHNGAGSDPQCPN